MDFIQKGKDSGLIKFDEEKKYITYIHQNKRRNYQKPEEKIQAETFLKLVLLYNYPPEHIAINKEVVIGSNSKEADIIVYKNSEHTIAHIVVECKKEEVSESEFNQAVKQAFSYAATGTVRAKYFWVTSKIKDEYYEIPEAEPKNYQSVTDILQHGVNNPAKFKYAKNGGEVNGQKLFDLKIVTEDELTRRFKQAHNALRSGGELNPLTAFDELDKLIFCKIWDEKKPRKNGEPYDFQIFDENERSESKKNESNKAKKEAKINTELKKRIESLYLEGRKKDPEVFKDDIRLSKEKIRIIVGYLQDINLSSTDLDSKGKAFETFMDSYFRGDSGQYFTPRPIVRFIVNTLPITQDSLILDTSCGSGGFLLHALDKVRKQANDYYKENTIGHYNYWHDFAEKNLFGIEINEQIARIAKMNMIIHGDGHTNIVSCDGLLPVDDIIEKDENDVDITLQQGIYSRTNNNNLKINHFDYIITNPPFGSTIKQVEQAYASSYKIFHKEIDWLEPDSKKVQRPNQSTEVLFIEQCYEFLKEGGYLAIVIPDGILTNSSTQYVRDCLEEMFRIVAIVSIPQTAFQATGAGVKTSVLFLKKHTIQVTEDIKNQKTKIKDEIKTEHDFEKNYRDLKTEKEKQLKELKGFENTKGLKGKELRESEVYKEWRQSVSEEYKEKIENLKQLLKEQYNRQKQKILDDYPIFMAIAKDIGYDATGRPTQNNELDTISKELARFIETIKKGEV